MAEKKRSFLDRLFGAEDFELPAATPAPRPAEDARRDTEGADALVAPTPEEPQSSVPPEVEQLPTEAAIVPPPSFPNQTDTLTPTGVVLQSWIQRLRTGLSRSSNVLSTGIADVLTRRRLDRQTIQELEDLLIQADLGVETSASITDVLARGRFNREVTSEEVRNVLAGEIERVLAPVAVPLTVDRTRSPFVILMVGVNGSGKTTTIGKLAAKFRGEGLTVMLAAGDTFRAAAIEQLKIWGERSGAPVIARDPGSDAAGLAFDAMVEARKAGANVLLIDTAGRLQNRTELMAELAKMVRVIRRHDATAPHAVLLTLDATTGQNALNQVEVFVKEAGVTGLVMTKLDGTARGGILVAIAARHRVPVHFLGVGEAIDDLHAFAARDFARAITGLDR